MAKLLLVLVIIVKVLLSNGQEEQYWLSKGQFEGLSFPDREGNPYISSFDPRNFTEQDHYIAVEPDDSISSVEYSAVPNTGFTATVGKDGIQVQPMDKKYLLEEKALRDYDRNYDFSEEADLETSYSSIDRKRQRHPYEPLFQEYSPMKRPKYPTDMEHSEYTHSFSINHQRDDLNAEASAHSHVGVNFDPNCKTKNKNHKQKHYTNGADLDYRKQKYPPLASDSYSSDYDKYVGEPSNLEIEKLYHNMYKQNDRYKTYKPDESSNWSSMKNGYSGTPDFSQSEDSYSDYLPPRPKKKHKPNKNKELYDSEDLDDYVLVPKKNLKKPPRIIDPYHLDSDEDIDENYEEERFHKLPRGTHTEIVRKVVKKKKPVINILDLFDI